MQAGSSEEKIRQVPEAATSPLFSERERVALEYAEAITVTGQKVTDTLFERLRRSFSELAPRPQLPRYQTVQSPLVLRFAYGPYRDRCSTAAARSLPHS